jgi:hypothetical protein
VRPSGFRPGGLTRTASSARAQATPAKFLGQLVQTVNTAPPGLTVIVGVHGQPQGTNRLAATVTVTVASADVRVPAEDETLMTLPGSLATASDQ